MADNNTATVNVPTELLKPIIEAKVVEALSGSENLLALDQARDGLEETIREASEGLRSVNKILRAKP